MVFDVLFCYGRDVCALPLRDRRARLEDIVATSDLVFPVRQLRADGRAACDEVIKRGFEGYVAKDEVSMYAAGPTRRWLRVKQKGWTIGDEKWTRRIGVNGVD